MADRIIVSDLVCQIAYLGGDDATTGILTSALAAQIAYKENPPHRIDVSAIAAQIAHLGGPNALTGINVSGLACQVAYILLSSESLSPSASPSISASKSPSISPSISPSLSPSASLSPSKSPSLSPSASLSPSRSPSLSPSHSPSVSPSFLIMETGEGFLFLDEEPILIGNITMVAISTSSISSIYYKFFEPVVIS